MIQVPQTPRIRKARRKESKSERRKKSNNDLKGREKRKRRRRKQSGLTKRRGTKGSNELTTPSSGMWLDIF